MSPHLFLWALSIMMAVRCVIGLCGESSSKLVTVSAKGRNTLVTSSLERRDGLHHTFEKANPLQVHTECRKQYTRRRSITSTKCLEEDEAPTTRSGIPRTFDFRSDCMFCAEPVTQSNKIPVDKRKSVSNVETTEFVTSVVNRAKERQDKWGNEVDGRMQHAYDLVAAEAKYHRQCCQQFFKRREDDQEASSGNLRREAFDSLCKFLDENDECQYSLQELSDQMSTYLDGCEGYTTKHLKTKLKERYGDEIVVTSITGKSSIVSFKDAAHRVLHEKWKSDKVTDATSQSDRIIDMAASIILNDIRLKVYDVDQYTPLESTESIDELIPASLNRFLHKLVGGKGKHTTVADRKCISITHAIISASRPRSFVSPLLLGLSVYIHRKYASRELIDILSSMSFADDYREVQRFEHALISGGEPNYHLDGFTQFVFDNADFNVATLSGHNTFHSMGGIACVTPPGKVETLPIERKVKLPFAEILGSFGHIPIKTYSKPAVPALRSVVVDPLKVHDEELNCKA